MFLITRPAPLFVTTSLPVYIFFPAFVVINYISVSVTVLVSVMIISVPVTSCGQQIKECGRFTYISELPPLQNHSPLMVSIICKQKYNIVVVK